MSNRKPNTPAAVPAKVTPGWRTGAVTFWWTTLAAAVVVSSIGNIVRANATAPEGWQTVAAWIGGGLPVTLMLLIEGIAIAERGGASGRARIIGLTILIPLLGVVLGNSYLGLLVIAEKTGHLQGHPIAVGLGYGLAALPDMLMVAATAYLMAFRSPVGAPTVGRWSRIGGALGDRVENFVAPKPPAPPVPITTTTPERMWAPSWEPEPTEPSEQTLPTETTPAPTSATPTPHEPSSAAAPGTAEGAERVGPESPGPVGAAVSEPVEMSAPAEPVTMPLPDLPEPTVDEVAEATRIVAAGVAGSADETMVARVLAAARRGPGDRGKIGMSQRKLAERFPLGRNTVTAILNQAAEAGPATPRALKMVGG